MLDNAYGDIQICIFSGMIPNGKIGWEGRGKLGEKGKRKRGEKGIEKEMKQQASIKPVRTKSETCQWICGPSCSLSITTATVCVYRRAAYTQHYAHCSTCKSQLHIQRPPRTDCISTCRELRHDLALMPRLWRYGDHLWGKVEAKNNVALVWPW